jgi:hypothetical protein
MRIALSVKIDLPLPDLADKTTILHTDTRDLFWQAFLDQAYLDRVKPSPMPTVGAFARKQEGKLSTKFAATLEEEVSRRQWPITILVKNISYGSLNIEMEVITGSLAALGLTFDDLLNLFTQYTPVAFERAVDNAFLLAPVNATILSSRVTEPDPSPAAVTSSAPPAAAQAAPAANTPQSRLEKIWIIANTSLVVPAAIMLVWAFFVFRDAGDERARLSASLIQERADIATQRERMLDRLGTQLKAFEDHLNTQSKHFSDLYDLESTMLKERLKQIKSPPDKEPVMATGSK